MTITNSITAYEDVRGTLDKALQAPKGIRVKFAEYGGAVHFRQRVYKFRKLEQTRLAKILEKTDPDWGKTPYDGLKATIVREEGEPAFFWVEIRTNDFASLDIEEIK